MTEGAEAQAQTGTEGKDDGHDGGAPVLCRGCGAALSGRQTAYCSRACYWDATRRHVLCNCFGCGKMVLRPRWWLRQCVYTFCSPACRRAARAPLMDAHAALKRSWEEENRVPTPPLAPAPSTPDNP